MKIEMGESLFYSWLRHVRECQLVQTNWKVSQKWKMKHAGEMDEIIAELKEYFLQLKAEGLDYHFFENSDRPQIIKQGECDALGINVQDGLLSYYAVDVAFHQKGLNYGNKFETAGKVIEKCVRTALCLYGYFDTKSGEIIFASPKIDESKLTPLIPLMEYINTYFAKKGFEFQFRLIYNEEFGTKVIQPIILVSEGVFDDEESSSETTSTDDGLSGDGTSDTSELFMRGYVLLKMFEEQQRKAEERVRKAREKDKKTGSGAKGTRKVSAARKAVELEAAAAIASGSTILESCNELKVGMIAQTVLRDILESGTVSDQEIDDMQTEKYSKDIFDIQYPLLNPTREKHYYKPSLTIKGRTFYLCCEWFESDKPYLIKWIQQHIDDSKSDTNE